MWGSRLEPVGLPELSSVDPVVQDQIRRKHQALEQKIAAGARGAELGAAYGEYGMLLHAAEFHEAAAPAYRNAQVLLPEDPRWPYYLALVYRSLGARQRAQEAFERVLALRPADVAALVHLARLYFDQGELDRAEGLFERARDQAPKAVAVLAGLGQVALARQQYARAVSLLEEALSIDPTAASIHSPLASAYRGLGDTARAEEHLKQWRNTEILVPDPLRLELDLALESGLSYELRGVRALESGDYEAAEQFFRRGVTLTSGKTALGRSLRHKLGTALFLRGHVGAAIEQFRATLEYAPSEGLDESTAKAHYSLGVLAASTGQMEEAIARLRASVRYSPTYVEAHLALADALRRAGRFEEALEAYREVLRLNPRAADARFGYAVALVRLGRHLEARRWLEDAVARQPDRPELAHALARVLAAAPDARARDGRRALAIVQELLKSNQSVELGETMAMTLAEVGDYEQAAAVQRGVIAAAERAGMHDRARRLRRSLEVYERRRPLRAPWPLDDPIHQPGPPVSASLGARG